MRVMMKGGVWKNTEDEILKAAVMKYGKNQWARISSLLVRKSPKQCKQRWYEWLDPSIKKTAWTREEEEKLLHLAKIMPTQWRTIAGCLDGRTPTQCLQHYEKLLDQAQGKDAFDGDDPRRLRPGEIDPNPENKPALPDPVDMDEDEKEMLQEARARLANTKGKKAKRKAREKTLDEAKRLAALQKRRELKAAGIHMAVPQSGRGVTKKKRVKMIDVMAEIPFHKTVPSGFYDTSKEEAKEEALRKNPRFKQMTLQKLEGERQDQVDERMKKKDNERMKKLKRDNLPVAMAKISELNDAKNVTKRPQLDLPAPQISNAELEGIAKVSMRGAGEGEEEEEGVTASLMPRVDQTPSITPMRTPLSSAEGQQGDAVMREAQYLAAVARETQTPLVGGTGPALTSTSDFSGSMPSHKPLTTPNMLKTPLVDAKSGGMTPKTAMLTPFRTPVSQDALAINRTKKTGKRGREDQEGYGDVEMAVEVKESYLFDVLGSLPAPKNEYQVVVPNLEEEFAAPRPKETMEMDAADVMKQSLSKQEELRRAASKLHSSAMQRGLPQPHSDKAAANLSGPYGNDIARLIAYDNAAADKEKKMGKKKRAKTTEMAVNPEDVGLEFFTEKELEKARAELDRDMEEVDLDAFKEAWETTAADVLFVKGKGFVHRSSLTKQELAGALKEYHSVLRDAIISKQTQSQKMESRIIVLHQGYISRCESMSQSMSKTYDFLEQVLMERQCFEALLHMESQSIPRRVAKLQSEVDIISDREEELQRQYTTLISNARKANK